MGHHLPLGTPCSPFPGWEVRGGHPGQLDHPQPWGPRLSSFPCAVEPLSPSAAEGAELHVETHF